jgi:hypothetical protein
MTAGPVEEVQPSAGDILPARPRMGLREAFGMSGSSRSEASAPQGAMARAVVAGATRALLGRDATSLELSLAERALAGEDLPAESMVERVIADLLALPEAAAWLAGSGTLPEALPVAGVAASSGRHNEDSVFAAIADGAFMSLLGRPAGEDNLRVFRDSMFQEYLESDLGAFICRFIIMVVRSPEWLLRFMVDQQRSVRLEFMPKQATTIGHVSLGASGFTAGMLRRFNLRRWSGPFDWLSASPAMIREIIADDFRSFLDPEAWAPIAAEDRPIGQYYQCRHTRYEARHGEACILHSADMTQDAGLAYMERCVGRFRQSLHGLASKILLQVVPDGDDPEREFRATADVLDRYGRSFQFVMVSVLPDHGEGPFPEVDPALAYGRHRLLRVRLLSPIIGIEATDMLDEVVLLRAALAAPSIGS